MWTISGSSSARPWAEWLAMISGAVYVPFEVFDLLRVFRLAVANQRRVDERQHVDSRVRAVDDAGRLSQMGALVRDRQGHERAQHRLGTGNRRHAGAWVVGAEVFGDRVIATRKSGIGGEVGIVGDRSRSGLSGRATVRAPRSCASPISASSSSAVARASGSAR